MFRAEVTFALLFVAFAFCVSCVGRPDPPPLPPTLGTVIVNEVELDTLSMWFDLWTETADSADFVAAVGADYNQATETERSRTAAEAAAYRDVLERYLAFGARSTDVTMSALAPKIQLLREFPEVQLLLEGWATQGEAQALGPFGPSPLLYAYRRQEEVLRQLRSAGVTNQIITSSPRVSARPGVRFQIATELRDPSTVSLEYADATAAASDAAALVTIGRRVYRLPMEEAHARVGDVLRQQPWSFALLVDEPGFMQTEFILVPGPERGLWPFKRQWERRVRFDLFLDNRVENPPGVAIRIIAVVEVRRTSAGDWSVDDRWGHQRQLATLLRMIDQELRRL